VESTRGAQFWRFSPTIKILQGNRSPAELLSPTAGQLAKLLGGLTVRQFQDYDIDDVAEMEPGSLIPLASTETIDSMPPPPPMETEQRMSELSVRAPKLPRTKTVQFDMGTQTDVSQSPRRPFQRVARSILRVPQRVAPRTPRNSADDAHLW